jgi:hypothetical protein
MASRTSSTAPLTVSPPQNPSWGPYVSNRQWGTVREDYSAGGTPWTSLTHDMARSKAYRWGEEGIAGICDRKQQLCFALAFWNKKDPIIKERFFGLSGVEGNHGEDVKELFYYLDATPSHSYLKMLYKYPQQAFPYQQLVAENSRRSRHEAEYEIMDTRIFDDNDYFDIFIEYAQAAEDDILIRITVCNRGKKAAPIHVLPTIWFRNTWSWGNDNDKPRLTSSNRGNVMVHHKKLGPFVLHTEQKAALLFCENETNNQRLYGSPNTVEFTKDGINDFLVQGKAKAVNRLATGTKAAINYEATIEAGGQILFQLRLEKKGNTDPFCDFNEVFSERQNEAEAFYAALQKNMEGEDEKRVQRQALAGMIWNKQFYYYNVEQWLKGDPGQVPPPPNRWNGRNHVWKHLNNEDIISMPDKWEYPWYAAWDLAFHCIPLAMIDPAFAKRQLLLLTKEWYMHPNGQLPAYEWCFNDVNPPVHAWAALRVYQLEKEKEGRGDLLFLEAVFHKLLLNFTWWVNRKDAEGNNIFEGGFLGLDNIGIFDRSAPLPNGGLLEQADGTSWMAMYSLNLMHMALELALHNPVYQNLATKFFEHFLYIAGAMKNIGNAPGNEGLWDDEDEFYYDVLHTPGKHSLKLKVRSMVGLIPLFAVEILDHELLEKLPDFSRRLRWFLDNRPDLAQLVSRWQEPNKGEIHLLSLLRGHRMKKILQRMLDETEFLSEYGIRSLSKQHQEAPYELKMQEASFSVAYTPGESTISIFGGNSNWRGPIWMPVNYLIIESLQRFHYYYTDEFRVECPTGSGVYLSLNEIADELSHRLQRLFLLDEKGRRPVFGDCKKMQTDPHFRDYILFYEYFHGDSGKGLGAAHQTGWTGLIAKLLQPRKNPLRSGKVTKEKGVL